MEYAVHLLIVLVAARVFGWVVSRLGQPALVGEILSGVVLALALAPLASGVPVLSSLVDSAAVGVVGNMGIFFLLLFVGVEMRPEEIAQHSRESFAVAVGGMLLPLFFGFALAWAVLPVSDLRAAQALVVGIVLAISAVPIAAKILADFGLLHEPIGEIVISAAVFDDVLGLILLAVATSLISTGNVPDIGTLALMLAKVATFFIVTGAIGRYAYPLIRRLHEATDFPALHLGMFLVIALLFSWFAEAMGMHFVVGAFMAGLFFEPSSVGEEAHNRIKGMIRAVTMGLLAPVFFASIGLRVELSAAQAIPGFLFSLMVVAFAGKLLGAGFPAYWSGLDRRGAFAVGACMNGRGAVGLVVTSIAYHAGAFEPLTGPNPIVDNLFSALVLTAVATTLMTPVLLAWILRSRDPNPED